jgi:hypothetical protein
VTVKELRERLNGYEDDVEVIVFFSQDDPFYERACSARTGYIGIENDQMFYDPDDFIEEDYDGAEDFSGELEEVLVIA